MSTISKVKRQINPELNVEGILLMLYYNRTNFAKNIKLDLEQNYGHMIKIFETKIPISVKVSKSISEEKSIFKYYKNSKVANAYFQFAKEFDNEKYQKKNVLTYNR